MRFCVVCATALAVWMVQGCKREEPAQIPPPPATTTNAVERPAPPAAQPPAAAAPAKDPQNLPPPTFAGAPGWLGFATVPKDGGDHYWSPSHPEAEAAIVSDEWTKVPEGTVFAAVTPKGVVEVTYQGTKDVRYGCEENTHSMALFDAPSRLPEGPVWILPPSRAQGASAVAIDRAQSGSKERAWKAAGMELVAKKTGDLTGKFEVRANGQVADSLAFEKGYMEGGDEEPMNLSDDAEVGLVLPLAAFRLGEGGPHVVVLGRRGYEGHGFQAVLQEGGRAPRILEDTAGLYYCAF